MTPFTTLGGLPTMRFDVMIISSRGSMSMHSSKSLPLLPIDMAKTTGYLLAKQSPTRVGIVGHHPQQFGTHHQEAGQSCCRPFSLIVSLVSLAAPFSTHSLCIMSLFFPSDPERPPVLLLSLVHRPYASG